jgi:hypothetical protein
VATALQAAGLVDTLKGPGPFTVFAPTDEAFAKGRRHLAVLTAAIRPGPGSGADGHAVA